MNASGLAARQSAAHTANRPRRPDWSAHSESSANAIASANGNAAERTIPAHSTAKVRLERRAESPHWRNATSVKASEAVAIVATASTLIPSTAASG